VIDPIGAVGDAIQNGLHIAGPEGGVDLSDEPDIVLIVH